MCSILDIILKMGMSSAVKVQLWRFPNWLCERVKRPFCPSLDLLNLGNWIFWTDGSDLLSLLMAGAGSESHPQHIWEETKSREGLKLELSDQGLVWF